MAILHKGTVIREEVGLSLDKADNQVLGTAAKVVVTKDSTTIVGDGTTQEEVNKRVTQIKNQIEVCILKSLKFFVPLFWFKFSFPLLVVLLCLSTPFDSPHLLIEIICIPLSCMSP